MPYTKCSIFKWTHLTHAYNIQVLEVSLDFGLFGCIKLIWKMPFSRPLVCVWPALFIVYPTAGVEVKTHAKKKSPKAHVTVQREKHIFFHQERLGYQLLYGYAQTLNMATNVWLFADRNISGIFIFISHVNNLVVMLSFSELGQKQGYFECVCGHC